MDTVPATSNLYDGPVRPIPTNPSEVILILSNLLTFPLTEPVPVQNEILWGVTLVLTEPSTSMFIIAVDQLVVPSYIAPNNENV